MRHAKAARYATFVMAGFALACLMPQPADAQSLVASRATVTGPIPVNVIEVVGEGQVVETPGQKAPPTKTRTKAAPKAPSKGQAKKAAKAPSKGQAKKASKAPSKGQAKKTTKASAKGRKPTGKRKTTKK